MKKNQIRGIIALAIIFAVWTLISFVVPFVKNAVFWLSYIFAVVAIAMQAYALYVGYIKGESAKSRLYGSPIAMVGTVYMTWQLAVSLICMVLARIIPWWLATVLYAVSLAVAAIGMISSAAIRDEIEHQDAKLEENVKTMRDIQSKVCSIIGICEDKGMLASVTALSEAMQYSDPVSSAELIDIENELAAMVNDIQKAATDGDSETVITLCKRATATLNERNRLCKLGK